jgi:hypothetical protein
MLMIPSKGQETVKSLFLVTKPIAMDAETRLIGFQS